MMNQCACLSTFCESRNTKGRRRQPEPCGGRSVGATAEEDYSASPGRPVGTTAGNQYSVSLGRPADTTTEERFAVCQGRSGSVEEFSGHLSMEHFHSFQNHHVECHVYLEMEAQQISYIATPQPSPPSSLPTPAQAFPCRGVLVRYQDFEWMTRSSKQLSDYFLQTTTFYNSISKTVQVLIILSGN